MGNTENNNITLADVADAMGVSKTTVSRVISGKGRIGKETRQRVMEYIEKSGYKPNVIAKGLAKSKTYNIAILLPTDCNISELPFFQSCTYGVCDAAAKRDYDVLVVYQNAEPGETLARMIDNHKIDGILVARTLVKDRTADYIKSRKIPLVAIGSSQDEELVQVDNDHLGACRELTASILAQGFRRIALVGGNPDHVVTRTRYRGFAEAFRDADMPVAADMVFLNVEREEQMDEVVESILAKHAEYIVCMDDMLCSRVLECLKQKEVTVPGQIRVASFYSSLLIQGSGYEIADIQFDVVELGRTACNVLLDMIEGKKVQTRRLLGYQTRIKKITK